MLPPFLAARRRSRRSSSVSADQKVAEARFLNLPSQARSTSKGFTAGMVSAGLGVCVDSANRSTGG